MGGKRHNLASTEPSQQNGDGQYLGARCTPPLQSFRGDPPRCLFHRTLLAHFAIGQVYRIWVLAGTGLAPAAHPLGCNAVVARLLLAVLAHFLVCIVELD